MLGGNPIMYVCVCTNNIEGQSADMKAALSISNLELKVAVA